MRRGRLGHHLVVLHRVFVANDQAMAPQAFGVGTPNTASTVPRRSGYLGSCTRRTCARGVSTSTIPTFATLSGVRETTSGCRSTGCRKPKSEKDPAFSLLVRSAGLSSQEMSSSRYRSTLHGTCKQPRTLLVPIALPLAHCSLVSPQWLCLVPD